MKRIAVLSSAVAVVGATAIAVATLFGTSGAQAAAPETFNAHVMGIRGAGAASGQSVTSSNMYMYNANAHVLGASSSVTGPLVYIDYWGSAWATGFSTCSGSSCYTSAQARTYTEGFFNNVGGSSWAHIDSQYCDNVAANVTSCATQSAPQYIKNGTAQLKGTYVHNTTLPKRISQSAIASEAVWAMNNVFGGYNPDALYLVYTPTGQSMSGFGTQWCAWHSNTTSNSQNVAYGYIPYIPDAGSSCGMNYVNKTNSTYGNGFFDGFSIVAGHEYSEAVTDPYPSTGSVAWQGPGGGSDEIGDKCAWSNNGDVSQNISLGGNSYAVQELWSNAVNGCAVSY